jgi:hypothetical protein
LAERNAAIIARYLPMDEYFEPRASEQWRGPAQKKPVLEAAAAQCHAGDTGLFCHARNDIPGQSGNGLVKSQPYFFNRGSRCNLPEDVIKERR